jgi:hypothetical protein
MKEEEGGLGYRRRGMEKRKRVTPGCKEERLEGSWLIRGKARRFYQAHRKSARWFYLAARKRSGRWFYLAARRRGERVLPGCKEER